MLQLIQANSSTLSLSIPLAVVTSRWMWTGPGTHSGFTAWWARLLSASIWIVLLPYSEAISSVQPCVVLHHVSSMSWLFFIEYTNKFKKLCDTQYRGSSAGNYSPSEVWLERINWPVHCNKHVNTLPQCSPTSVGLAQACPNYQTIHNGFCPTKRALLYIRGSIHVSASNAPLPPSYIL